MSTVYQAFDESNYDEVLDLARSRFTETDLARLDHALRNPARENGSSAGLVAYEDGRAVCMMAQFARKVLFADGSSVPSAVLGFLCKARHAFPKEKVTEFLREALSGKDGRQLYIGNTAIRASMNQFAAVKAIKGPESWLRTRFAILRPLSFLAFVLSRKLLKRENRDTDLSLSAVTSDGMSHNVGDGLAVRRVPGFDDRYTAFWNEYLAGGHGIVSSRTREDVTWAFGDALAKGEAALLGLFRGETLEGITVLVPMANSRRRWLVKDMIVLGDDAKRLAGLLNGAKKFLRRETPALTLEAIGFPSWTEGLFAKALPLLRRGGHNPYVLKATDLELESKFAAADAPGNWFYGPYDGDSYLLKE